MKQNIGTFDRILRAAVGALLLIGAWWFKSWLLLAFALFSFYQAIAGWCFFYQLIGKNTCPLN